MTTPMTIRLPADEVAALDRAAAKRGITRSEFLRNLNPLGALRLEVDQPYTFDRGGHLRRGPDTHDFCTDLVRGLRDGDKPSLRRATGFVSMMFDVVSSNVAGLNPPAQRNDLYGGQPDFAYPLWDAVNAGVIDGGPFIVPTFTSAAGLAAGGTQGTEPSSGTFVTGSTTVTPTTIIGKARLSREVWDAGGNPQSSDIIWRQMVQGWLEALEAATFTYLETLAPTTITVTTAAADVALQDSLLSQLAPLDYARGGWRLRNLALQVDLYGKLAAAKDTAGNKLFPMLYGSDGVTDTGGALAVAGRIARPAWALAATGSVSANSYLIDSSRVLGWATAPQRLELTEVEVSSVGLGLWGYKAFAVTDLAGLRRIAYDPV